MDRSEKLALMANQIARNLARQGGERTAALTADHITRFWDPRMRAAIIAFVAGGGALEPGARAAVLLLSETAPQDRSVS